MPRISKLTKKVAEFFGDLLVYFIRPAALGLIFWLGERRLSRLFQ